MKKLCDSSSSLFRLLFRPTNIPSFMEGARLRGTVALYRDYIPASSSDAAPATVIDTSSPKPSDSDKVTVPIGHRVLVDLSLASQDPVAFPDPTSVRLDRPLDTYLHYGWGPHQCAGMDASMTAMTAMFKIVFGLRGLKRATTSWGESPGELKKIPGPHGLTAYMTPDQSSFFPFPTTMKIQWEQE